MILIMIALYIFILIHPCYIYFFIDFIALYYVSCFHAASSMSWYLSFMYAYIVLYAFKYLYDDTYARTYILYIFTYLIYAFFSPCLYDFYAALLLYDTHIFAASRAGSGAFQYMRSIYLYPLGVCSTGAQCT